jgi:hypothetical protein
LGNSLLGPCFLLVTLLSLPLQSLPLPGPCHSEQQLCDYYDLLQQATGFIKQQRRLLQQRQATLLEAQEDWRQGLAAVERHHRQQQSEQHESQQETDKAIDATESSQPGSPSGTEGDKGGGKSSVPEAPAVSGGGSGGIAEVAQQQALSGFRELKQQLQSQVHQLNADTRLLRQLKAQVSMDVLGANQWYWTFLSKRLDVQHDHAQAHVLLHLLNGHAWLL